MIYLLLGENSYRALAKIQELKATILKKGGSFAIEEIDGLERALDEILSVLGGTSLFSQKRLVILKSAIASYPELANFFIEHKESLRDSQDIFVFWELALDEEVHKVFESYAKQVQEVAPRSFKQLDLWLQKESVVRGVKLDPEERRVFIENAGENAEWALEGVLEQLVLVQQEPAAGNENSRRGRAALELNSDLYKGGVKEFSGPVAGATRISDNAVFAFADKIFANRFARSLLAFREATAVGIEVPHLLFILFWKLKNIFLVAQNESKSLNPYVARKTQAEISYFDQKTLLDMWWRGMLTDSLLKKDSKNTAERMEDFLLAFKKGSAKPI